MQQQKTPFHPLPFRSFFARPRPRPRQRPISPTLSAPSSSSYHPLVCPGEQLARPMSPALKLETAVVGVMGGSVPSCSDAATRVDPERRDPGGERFGPAPAAPGVEAGNKLNGAGFDGVLFTFFGIGGGFLGMRKSWIGDGGLEGALGVRSRAPNVGSGSGWMEEGSGGKGGLDAAASIHAVGIRARFPVARIG